MLTIVLMRSCVSRWILEEEGPRSGMAVLEVAVPTGYIIQQQTLDGYVQWLAEQARRDAMSSNIRPVSSTSRLANRQEQSHRLQRARFTEHKVYFYFDYVSIFHRGIR